MYEFVTENNAAEFERFMSESKYGNFLQASIWAGVKKEWDSRRIISRDDNGNVRAAMLLLIRKVPHLPFSYLYAPRGPVCEPDEADGMMDLINAVREVAKQTNGYIFKCDPSFLADDERFKKSAEKCGLQLLPAGKNFDGVQPNFVFRLNIEGKTEDEIFENFHSKWRYNIRLASRKGVTVRIGDRSDLPKFHEIMKVTGERDHFGIRPLEYFENMYDVMYEKNLRLYVAEIDGEMVSGTIAIYYGDKVWYLYGASDNEHRNCMPNYLLQWEMIKWAVELGCKIYDFRGVSGDLSPENPLYGLYRFKKGFNGELLEFVGEAQIVFKPFVKKCVDLGQKILR